MALSVLLDLADQARLKPDLYRQCRPLDLARLVDRLSQPDLSALLDLADQARSMQRLADLADQPGQPDLLDLPGQPGRSRM